MRAKEDIHKDVFGTDCKEVTNMEEKQEGTQQAAQEAYVRQLGRAFGARAAHDGEQKQRNAAKNRKS